MRRQVDVGDGYTLDIHEITGDAPGPVLAVLGGVHGDELEGVTAARLLLRQLQDESRPRLRGTVRVVPTANPPAFAARQRSSPVDGANLARVFPGAADGTLTQRIADVITKQVITGANLFIDLHSAGTRYQMPVFAGYVLNDATRHRARAACREFGAPFLWEHVGTNPGRSLTTGVDLQVPSIYVEGSGGGGLIGTELDIYFHGLLRLMRWLNMIDAAPEGARPSVVLEGGDGNTDTPLACSTAGYCVTRVRPGAVVEAGSVLAEILDDEARVVEQIRNPEEGTVMMLLRPADVKAGDGIAMMGPVPSGHDA